MGRLIRAPLPIDEVLPSILAALKKGPNLVVRAPPGAGKTTRVGPAMLDANLVGPKERILMLQPRRVAARASARRIASERGGRVGDEIGYQVRFEDRTSSKTRLAVLTEGLLTRRLQSDPTLEGVGAVILDEFHERSIHADLSIAFLREIQETVRPELKIVVMSATLETQGVARFLGDAPIIDSPGRLFPIRIEHLERSDDRPVIEQTSAAIRRALRAEDDDGGDFLVFLPGAFEIRRVEETIREAVGDRPIDVLPLFGELDAEAQDRALERTRGRRKIVLATNIAETSLTIDGVTTVIDAGLARVNRHDPSRGGDKLETVRISRASADQRAGRAGRTAPGRVLRLWTAQEDQRLAPSESPEIARVDLAPVMLEVLAWGASDPRQFGWYEAPPSASVDRALEMLRALGALAEKEHRLTPLGETLRRFPLHPRLAAVLVDAHRRGAAEEGALIAALASERDILRFSRDPSARHDEVASSDLWLRAERFLELEEGRFSGSLASRMGVDADRARGVREVRDRLAQLSRDILGAPPKMAATADAEEIARHAVLAGFPDRVGRRRAEGSDKVVLVGSRGARLAKESAVKTAELLVAVDLDDSRRSAAEPDSMIRWASAVERSWLEASPVGVRRRSRHRYNRTREAVEAAEEVLYLDLLLEERVDTSGGDPEGARQVLAAAAAENLDRALTLTGDIEGLVLRIELLARLMPDLGLVPIDRSYWISALPDLCEGRRSFAELRKINLEPELRQRLGFKKMAEIDRHAPERITVPSGSAIRLRYEQNGFPVLSVRLQEVFGMATTPKVAGGRAPVRLELLAPNMRPVQVTQDLDSFWDRTYAEVKKELRARYPRHSWPDDPRSAPAVKGPRRRH